jgi:hypothetical protein
MRMKALRPWINWDHEGIVHAGQFFEATERRARELRLSGLAEPSLEGATVMVVPDPPVRRDEPVPKQPRRSSFARRGASEMPSTSVR